MAATKISALTALTTIATGDLMVTVDISDTTMGVSGTNKKITWGELMGAPGAIGGTTPAPVSATTLAVSSTISGAGVTALFASPPDIGGTTRAAGAFTSVAVSAAGVSVEGNGNLTAQALALGGIPTFVRNPATGEIIANVNASTWSFQAVGAPAVQFDNSSTATHTRLLLWDVDAGALVRVSVGAAAGGFKPLLVPA